MIELERVSKWFGRVEAVHQASLSVARGQVVGLLGPNGAGKSTMIRMIVGYLRPTTGAVTVDGHDTVDDGPGARRLIGYLPDANPLYPEMRVVDYLDHRSRLLGVRRRQRRAAIDRSIDRCALAEVRRRRTAHLSKGFRQRVGLAAALLHDPPVLVLDEPTSGLDPGQIRETRSLIRDLAERRTVVVSSHILPEVERTCDRVVIVARGRVRADGSPRELVAELQKSSPVTVEVVAEGAEAAARAIAALRAAAGDGSVKSAPDAGAGRARFEIAPGSGGGGASAGDLCEHVGRVLAAGGFVVTELSRNMATLERVFLGVIESDDRETARRDELEREGTA